MLGTRTPLTLREAHSSPFLWRLLQCANNRPATSHTRQWFCPVSGTMGPPGRRTVIIIRLSKRLAKAGQDGRFYGNALQLYHVGSEILLRLNVHQRAHAVSLDLETWGVACGLVLCVPPPPPSTNREAAACSAV